MDKRILLPTDFSKNALNAIRYALNLYKDQRCDIYFLNTYQIHGYSIDSMMVPEPGEKFYEAAKKRSLEGFERLGEILKLHGQSARHTYHTISTYNSLLYAIKSTIAKEDIDIVVMGTKGATGSSTILFGTNTVDTMQKVTECPVIAVPEHVVFTTPKEIIFPTDYTTGFKRKEIRYLKEISKLHGSFIRVLHIKEAPELSRTQESNKTLLEAILEDVNHSFHMLGNIKVHKGIAAFVESRGSDMIAFVNRKHSFFGNMFSKPLVKQLGYHSRIPVLVLNDYS
ncbi:universal stress protein [Ulvibacterium sp.]|uniref:universal stress protein n=1 Tax=Ulvibacterium sp. TaxID=2665914 RepID=UPI002608A4DB|nr:universal stress protein [Ulvibacterium sp.]